MMTIGVKISLVVELKTGCTSLERFSRVDNVLVNQMIEAEEDLKIHLSENLYPEK